MTFFNRFLKNAEPGKIGKGGTTLVAVSGGPDSVVLAHLYLRAGLKFAIAHCNFQLRGEESNEDAAFVEKLAEQLGVPFLCRSFDTLEVAFQYNMSIQMAARELRYRWFEQLRQEFGYQRIATAHHLNDSIETALLNFTKGTGLKGLGGIRLWNEKHIVRPLIGETKETIMAFASEQKIKWREDSSNASDKYQRNKVRLNIIPLFEEINPAFVHTAGDNLRRLQETNDAFNYLAKHYLSQIAQKKGQDSIVMLSELKDLPGLPTLLYKWLHPLGLNEDQVQQVHKHIESGELLEIITPEKRVSVTRERLIIGSGSDLNEEIEIEEDDMMVPLPDGSRLTLMRTQAAEPYPDGRETVLLNADLLHFPLVLRHWRTGDSFSPFGMKGLSQKLQDFFTNHKLAPTEKDRVWLMTNREGDIVWVLGMRLDHRFRILDDTKQALKIHWKKAD